MEKYFPALLSSPLFLGIAEADVRRILDCLGARAMQYARREVILREGTPASYIGLVLSGTVHIAEEGLDGSRNLVESVSAGGLFLEAFACVGTKALPVEAVAAEDSIVLLLDANHILHTCQHHCGHHAAMIFNLMRNMAGKSLELHEKISVTSRRTTREKLLSYLTACAKRTGARSFQIPFDRQELADYLEVDRSGLSAEIGKLRREGILESHKRSFKLL